MDQRRYYILLAPGVTRGVCSSLEELADLVDANLEASEDDPLYYEVWQAGATVPNSWDWAYLNRGLNQQDREQLPASLFHWPPKELGKNLLRS